LRIHSARDTVDSLREEPLRVAAAVTAAVVREAVRPG
jgi:hypothetical protein